MLDLLAAEIGQLKVEFERFFNGAAHLPPEELRERIQARLRGLRNTTFRAAADNFRFADLESRFNSWNELFNRRLRDLEEGRRPPRPAPSEPEPGHYDPERGVLVRERIEPAAAEALYAGLAAGPDGGPRFDLVTFAGYLARQAAAIRDKTGCDAVQFRVAVEDGKRRLKARPITE
ncbi:MAG TPA: MXAN_5187 C-terminal domain-containing protein [Thermoanaerobaculia bacterium]|nr:MXAN_5187 C-terminal domain-containing protein [Thermoanaerobaculia bacterium]